MKNPYRLPARATRDELRAALEEAERRARRAVAVVDPGQPPNGSVGIPHGMWTHWHFRVREYEQVHWALFDCASPKAHAEMPAPSVPSPESILPRATKDWDVPVESWECRYRGCHTARVVGVSEGLYAAFVDRVYFDSYDDFEEACGAVMAFVELMDSRN